MNHDPYCYYDGKPYWECAEADRYVEHRLDEDLAFNRTPGLVLLLVATAIGSAVSIILYLTIPKNSAKHPPKPKPPTIRSRTAVTGVRG